jgi:hypothetical protein
MRSTWVAWQHEIGGIRGMLEQFSKMDTCFSTIDGERSTARTVGAAVRADILAALRRSTLCCRWLKL